MANNTARRTDEALWQKIVREVKAGDKGGNPGQWSARKAQLAVARYKQAGGDYIGPKSKDNALAKWTKQKWRTKSGKPALETGERYLPSAAIDSLTDAEYKATSKAKRRGMRKGQQFVPQPDEIAAKTARFRRSNPPGDSMKKSYQREFTFEFRKSDPDAPTTTYAFRAVGEGSDLVEALTDAASLDSKDAADLLAEIVAASPTPPDFDRNDPDYTEKCVEFIKDNDLAHNFIEADSGDSGVVVAIQSWQNDDGVDMTSVIDTNEELDLSKMAAVVSDLEGLDEEDCLRIAAYADSYGSIDPAEVSEVARNRDIDIYPDTDMSDLAVRFVEEGIIDTSDHVDMAAVVEGLEHDGWSEVSVDIDELVAEAWEVSAESAEAEEKYEEEYGDEADDEEWLEENPAPVYSASEYSTVQAFVEAVQEWQESFDNRNDDSDKPTLEEYMASEREAFIDDCVAALRKAGLRGDCDCVLSPGADGDTYDSLLEALNNGECNPNTTLERYAEELVAEGVIDTKRLSHMIDYDSIERDLDMDYTEFEFDGRYHVYRLG
jgi:hypothetical protein